MNERDRPFDFYTGPSMGPTLKPLDRLKIIPYGNRFPRPGDVVVFRSPADGQRMTHRIFQITAQGIQTRGDHNPEPDPWRHSHGEIIGQVVATQRNRKWIPVHGGIRGRFRARMLQLAGVFRRMGYRFLRASYHTFQGLCLPRLGLPGGTAFQVAAFNRPEGIEYHLLLGPILLARSLAGNGRWQLRKPYTWFLHEASLPDPPRLDSNEQEAV